MSRNAGLALGLIVAVYLLIGVQYALLTPAWQTPDEPAHYNVVRQIAQTGALPVLEPGDYDQAYLETLTREHFPVNLPLDKVQYQDYQPPLYYLLATPIFLLTNGSLTALRLFSLLLGAGVIVVACLTLRALTGPESPLPLIAAGFIAFIPQHIAMLAGANNDSLSELLIALGLWLCLRQARRGLQPWALGVVLGLAFVTKVQAYVLAPVMALMLARRWQSAPNERPALVRAALIIFGLGLALGAVYWGRNLIVCGPLDFVCGNHHNQVVVGQPRTSDWINQYGAAEVARRLLQTTFQSFWGQFGWMGVLMDARVYAALLVFSLAVFVGALGAARGWRAWPAVTREGLQLLGLSALVTVALFGYYNLGFVQHQGRYLFPALVPLGLIAAAGLQQWARWISRLIRRVGRATWLAAPAETWLPVAAIALLAVLSLVALYRFILPDLVR